MASRITSYQTAKILKDHLEHNMSQRELAKKYKVSRTTIGRIIKEHTDLIQDVTKKKYESIEAFLIDSASQRADMLKTCIDRIQELMPTATYKELVGFYKVFIDSSIGTDIALKSEPINIRIDNGDSSITEDDLKDGYNK